jgi:Tetraspanin family
MCGIVVLLVGFFLFTDKKRILLSSLLVVTSDESNILKNLRFPLFLYVAFMLIVFGMFIVSISLIGYWTALLNNCCLLSAYFTLVLLLLLLKFALCIVITVYPQSLGLNMNVTEMVKILQGSYGVPGQEHYTVALDFAQTHLDCCGINDSINFDTSFWRLQKLGKKDLTVPLTCCALMNKYEENSCKFDNHDNLSNVTLVSSIDLDPVAINETLCQSLESIDFQKSRHLEVCV